MKERTSEFIETVRNIYLHLNKNYTTFLKLDLLDSEDVELNRLFNPDLLREYCSDKHEVNYLLDGFERGSGLLFSTRFDFRTSDAQKAFGANLLAKNMVRAATRLKFEKRPVTVLSLGIGDGTAAQNYAHVLDLPHPDELIGIDVHSHYLDQAVVKITHLTVHRFDLNDLARGSRLPLKDGCVDIAECAMVAHHIERFEPLVSEVGRVLKSGGRFFYLDLIDKTLREENMQFEHDHKYPSFHGIEFFRDHLTIRKTVKCFLTIEAYLRVGPGILYLEARR